MKASYLVILIAAILGAVFLLSKPGKAIEERKKELPPKSKEIPTLGLTPTPGPTAGTVHPQPSVTFPVVLPTEITTAEGLASIVPPPIGEHYVINETTGTIHTEHISQAVLQGVAYFTTRSGGTAQIAANESTLQNLKSTLSNLQQQLADKQNIVNNPGSIPIPGLGMNLQQAWDALAAGTLQGEDLPRGFPGLRPHLVNDVIPSLQGEMAETQRKIDAIEAVKAQFIANGGTWA